MGVIMELKIFTFFIMVCLVMNLASADILSVNSHGSGEMVLISESNIEGFFSGSPSVDYIDYLSLGYNYYSWLDYSETQTTFGNGGLSGMTGKIKV